VVGIQQVKSAYSTDRSPPVLTTLFAPLVIIDPQPLTLRAITQMLAEAFPGKAAFASTSSKELPEFQDEAATASPPLVVLYLRDASISDGWVEQELRLIWGQFPEARVTLLSDRDDTDDVAQAISRGVRGYIPASLNCDLAVAALRIVDVGGTYVPAHAVSSTPREPHCLPKNELDFTDREITVARLLSEGRSNKVIARVLEIEEATVKVHVRNILKKLHVANRTQAAIVVDDLLGLSGSSSSAAGTNVPRR
jgi:DNA-binding NarL/FixJ family response regulator